MRANFNKRSFLLHGSHFLVNRKVLVDQTNKTKHNVIKTNSIICFNNCKQKYQLFYCTITFESPCTTKSRWHATATRAFWTGVIVGGGEGGGASFTIIAGRRPRRRLLDMWVTVDKHRPNAKTWTNKMAESTFHFLPLGTPATEHTPRVCVWGGLPTHYKKVCIHDRDGSTGDVLREISTRHEWIVFFYLSTSGKYVYNWYHNLT